MKSSLFIYSKEEAKFGDPVSGSPPPRSKGPCINYYANLMPTVI